jgi:hypothetical protein
MDKIAKAVTAALIAGYGVYESVSAAGLTADEWVRVVVFTLVAGLGVYLVPNTPAPPSE